MRWTRQIKALNAFGYFLHAPESHCPLIPLGGIWKQPRDPKSLGFISGCNRFAGFAQELEVTPGVWVGCGGRYCVSIPRVFRQPHAIVAAFCGESSRVASSRMSVLSVFDN